MRKNKPSAEVLYDEYHVQHIAPKDLAAKYNCTTASIRNWLKEYGFDVRAPGDRERHRDALELSQYTQEILDGWIVSDAYISKHNDKTNSRIVLCSKHKEFVQHTRDLICDNIWTKNPEIRIRISKDNRCQKSTTAYYLETQKNITFSAMRDRWYRDDKRIVPPDFKLTPTIALYWYLGDGHLETKSPVNHRITLSTDSFHIDDIRNILLPQMEKFCPHLSPSYQQDVPIGYRIRISGAEHIQAFFDYVGVCPLATFNYKFPCGYQYVQPS